MGQAADSQRNASLDQRKERAAGRAARTGQSAPGQEAMNDNIRNGLDRGATGGAFGKQGVANRRGDVGMQGGGEASTAAKRRNDKTSK